MRATLKLLKNASSTLNQADKLFLFCCTSVTCLAFTLSISELLAFCSVVENPHGAVHAQQAWCSPLSLCWTKCAVSHTPDQPAASCCPQQNLHSLTAVGSSSFWTVLLFHMFPMLADTCCLLPFSVSSLDSHECYLLIFLQLHHCLVQHLQHLPFSQKKFLLQNLMKYTDTGNLLKAWKCSAFSFIISCFFFFNFSLVEEENDSFGCDALEMDGKQEDIMYNWNMS